MLPLSFLKDYLREEIQHLKLINARCLSSFLYLMYWDFIAVWLLGGVGLLEDPLVTVIYPKAG